jgi:predicted transcriptional regulator
MARTVPLSLRISADKAREIDRLAAATERPRAWILERAVEAYLDTQSWQIERIERGIEDLERGQTVPHDRVAGWLESWGQDDEGDPPP